MAVALKVNRILELDTTNLIPNHSITSLFCTFSLQRIFIMQKETRDNKQIQLLNVHKV